MVCAKEESYFNIKIRVRSTCVNYSYNESQLDALFLKFI